GAPTVEVIERRGAIVAGAAQARAAQQVLRAQRIDRHAAGIERPALRLASDRVDVVVGAVAAGVGIASVQRQRALAGPVAVAQLDLVAVVELQRTGDAPVVARGAGHGGPAGLLAAAVLGGVVLELDGGAIVFV